MSGVNGAINKVIKQIRELGQGIIDTADDQLVSGPRDRPDLGCVISDLAGLGEKIKDEADKLMQHYEEVNRCRFCGEIPEDCTCSRGGRRDK